MALVKFVSGTFKKYEALTTKDANTLYFITDQQVIYKGDVIYSSSQADYEALVDSVDKAENNITSLETLTASHTTSLTKLEGAASVAGSVAEAKKAGTDAQAAVTTLTNGQVATNKSDIAGLKTRMSTAEGNITANATAAQKAQETADAKVASVAAGNGITIGGTTANPTVAAKVSATAGNVLKVDSTGLYVPTPAAAPEYSIVKDSNAGDYAAVYHLTKGGANTGVAINIPKDMVVSSGEVVKNPEGKDAGTYLVLTLANATNDKVYIPVTSLIDIYTTGSAAADKVQIAVDGTTNKISATVKAGSIELTDLTQAVQNKINAAVPNTRTVAGKALSANISAADLRTALNVANGAEVNQNAFSNVKVGTTTIAAGAKTDTVEVAAGSHVTVTADATGKKVTIDTTGLETAGTAQNLINALDVTDTAVAGQYVSAVSETNGKISVTRASLPAAPTAADLGAVTTINGDDHITFTKSGTTYTAAVKNVATATQGTNGQAAYDALTWGTL